MFECYKWILFSSVHLHRHKFKVSVLSYLIKEYKWLTEYEAKEQHLNCHFYSVLLPMLQSDPMERRAFGPLRLQTGRQWAKASSCPVRTTNIHSLVPFLHVSPLSLASSLLSLLGSATPTPPHPFGLWLSLGRASTSLGILAGGALCLRGWGGPRGSFWRKTQGNNMQKRNQRLFVLSSSKVVWHS